MKLEYKLVATNRVCPGIHKVRVGLATWRVVATCKYYVFVVYIKIPTIPQMMWAPSVLQ